MAEREKRLNELEAKAKQLRDQLQQRKQTKAEIQKMLVMLIENPQGGLGLPASWMNAINQPIYSFPSTTVEATPPTPPPQLTARIRPTTERQKNLGDKIFLSPNFLSGLLRGFYTDASHESCGFATALQIY